MNIEFSYESRNQSSYLLAVFPADQPVVQYQLKTIVNNEIEGLLPVMKRQSDGQTLIYYNITSKIALSQITGRRKLSKKEFLNLLSGTVSAWKEAEEYQLEGEGLYLEADYIFVQSDTCRPDFVYLPIYGRGQGTPALKEFIQKLILGGIVETAADNFIQVLLNTLNEEDFSIEKLEACLKKLQGRQRAPEVSRNLGRNIELAEHRQTPPPEPVPRAISPVPEIQKSSPRPVLEPLPAKPAKEPVKAAAEAGNEGEDKEKGKKKFLLFQAPVLVCLSALASFGAFTDAETGALLTSNILAALLIAAALEFVVYREVFVNSKKKKGAGGKKEKKQKSQKTSSQRERKGRKVVIPGREPEPRAAAEPEREPTPEKLSAPEAVPADRMPGREIPVPAQRKEEEAPTELNDRSVYSGGDMEATDFWDPSQNTEKYLEYMESGIPVRIPLHAESFLIGRLESQVDFAVRNPRVGKIHAEFICQGNQCYVKDLNSKNGTYLNGSRERIASNMPCLLTDGDRIALADSEFIFHA